MYAIQTFLASSRHFSKQTAITVILSAIALVFVFTQIVGASSHREAPLIANDPLADNTILASRCIYFMVT